MNLILKNRNLQSVFTHVRIQDGQLYISDLLCELNDFIITVPDSLFNVTITEVDLAGRPANIFDCAITRAARRVCKGAWVGPTSLWIDEVPYKLTPQAYAFRLAFDRGNPCFPGKVQLI